MRRITGKYTSEPEGKRLVQKRRKAAEKRVPTRETTTGETRHEIERPAHHPVKTTRNGALERGFMAG
jgi:hypothetical protein